MRYYESELNYVAKGKFDGNPNAANTLINRLRTLEKIEPIGMSVVASDAVLVNLTKNKDGSKGSSITGGAVNELKLTHAKTVQEMKCFDTFKKAWKGSPLELVL